MPGIAYGLPGHIRVGVGGGASVNLHAGLDRLARCLAEWPEDGPPAGPQPGD
jgi:hypothetical protein